MFKRLRGTDWYPLILLIPLLAMNNSSAWTWLLWAVVAVFAAVGLLAGLADKITPSLEHRWILATAYGVVLIGTSHMWGWRNSTGWHIGLAVVAIASLGLVLMAAWRRGTEDSLPQ